MNAEQAFEYIKGGGNLCPFCHSYDISGGHFESNEDGQAWQYVSCKVCGEEWRDCYTLVDVI